MTAAGRMSGKSVGSRTDSCNELGSTRPVNVIMDAASNRPMSIDPVSPMNIFAGLMLCGRKPMQTPARRAHVSVANVARSI